MSGTLAKDNETDTVKFTAKKGDRILFKVGAHYLGSNLDPVFIVENAEGKELKRVDDTKPTVDSAGDMTKSDATSDATSDAKPADAKPADAKPTPDTAVPDMAPGDSAAD